MMTRAPRRAVVLTFVPLAFAFVYLLSPYVALWRLSEALQAQDCRALRVAIDWNRVRASLQDELSGAPAATPAPIAPTARLAVAESVVKPVATAADDDLPAFGDSFASTATGNALAADLTPESVAAMMHDHPVQVVGTGRSLLAEARQMVDWAFFSGPRSFDVWLSPAGVPHEPPVRLHMAFTRQHGWRVIGVWLPQEMLAAGDAAHST